MPETKCQLCSTPGGYPYCDAACKAADQPDEDGDYTVTFLAIDTRKP
ncbi:hypothetical protein [Streptomyces katrae]|nr:hypothetical protein [Streptomyces katrae]